MPRGICVLFAAWVAVAAGCGKEDFKRTSKRGLPEDPMAANLKDVGKPSVEVIAEKAEKQEASEKKRRRASKDAKEDLELPKVEEFTERDFVENEQESRDPFRNPLMKEAAKLPVEVIQPGDVVFLKDYSLAELRVDGIVGGARRYAMVLDPRTGRTTILQKRDRIAKERALIFEVNQDHLLVLVPRLKPGKEDPFERRTLYVDEQRKMLDIGSEALRPDETGIRYSSPRRRSQGAERTKEP
ncbi:MAG: hypothetical protein RBU30_00125 [Polyangia bacterium]|nr:hypothetical protein [Polyangia bacterium]